MIRSFWRWLLRRPAPLRAPPLTRLASAPEGIAVRVRGRLSAAGTSLLVAPLSGRPCLFWELRASRPVQGRGRSPEVFREARAVDAVLRDATGEAPLPRALTDYDARSTVVEVEVDLAAAPAAVRELLGGIDGVVCLRETRLEEGEEVFAAAQVRRDGAALVLVPVPLDLRIVIADREGSLIKY